MYLSLSPINILFPWVSAFKSPWIPSTRLISCMYRTSYPTVGLPSLFLVSVDLPPWGKPTTKNRGQNQGFNMSIVPDFIHPTFNLQTDFCYRIIYANDKYIDVKVWRNLRPKEIDYSKCGYHTRNFRLVFGSRLASLFLLYTGIKNDYLRPTVESWRELDKTPGGHWSTAIEYFSRARGKEFNDGDAREMICYLIKTGSERHWPLSMQLMKQGKDYNPVVMMLKRKPNESLPWNAVIQDIDEVDDAIEEMIADLPDRKPKEN